MLTATLSALLVFQVGISVEVKRENPHATDKASSDTTEIVLDSATLASAYADSTAREWVRLARERHEEVDRSIYAYRTLARERFSISLSALRRERLFYREESASRIHWKRFGSTRIEALGARNTTPLFSAEPSVTSKLERHLPRLAFDPAEPAFTHAVGDSDFFRYPLAHGSEADYTFASGDTTRIQLPDGQEVHLFELRLTPRRSESRLLSGVIWLEAESHAVVQMTFQLARAFDLERDAEGPDDIEDVPSLLLPIRADFRYMTVEYGLWEMKWWLPRIVAFEGYGQAGRFLRIPIRYERSYSEYRVTGDTLGLPPVRIALVGDTLTQRRREYCQAAGWRCRRKTRVVLPDDSTELLTSEHLPESIFEEGEQFVWSDEVHAVLDRLGHLPDAPTDVRPPRLFLPHQRAGLSRYNRVEGSSLGVQAEAGYGKLDARLTTRIGIADLEPRAELSLQHHAPRRTLEATIYRRLTPVTEHPDPFGLGNSLTALLAGRDDGDYYDGIGVELRGAAAGSARPWYDWRLYAEQQRPVEVETHTHLRRVFKRDAHFRPNLQADRADQLGAELALRTGRGLDPKGFRWAAETELRAETGTFRFARVGATLTAGRVLGTRVRASLETAAGTTFGTPPSQSTWSLGGPATLRGYSPLSATGESFWRARAELSTSAPGTRLALFSDIGWAGPRDDFGSGQPLVAIGSGATVLDDWVRLDVARAIRNSSGWRIDLYIDRGL